MKKFTRKFNNSCARFSFWEALSRHCEEFKNLLTPCEYLTNQDRQILSEIHGKFYEFYELVKSQKLTHLQHLKFLRSNYHV